MALANLATSNDMDALGITGDAATRIALARAASAAVREAAGCTITESTGTVTITGGEGRYLALPGWAIRSVASVLIDGVPTSDWRLLDGRLFRRAGWGCAEDPPPVTVTYTQGVNPAPADIVNLVCSLVAAGMAAVEDGYDPHRGISSERIDDYQRSFTRGDDEVVNPMELPQSTRAWLAGRFGGGTHVTAEMS